MGESDGVIVHNGWRRFTPDTAPWTEDRVYWAFLTNDRSMSAVLYDGPARGWTSALDGTPVGAESADFILPASAFPPPAPDRQVFRNPLPVVVMLVMSNRGLVVVRRGLSDGYGKLALPGGFQDLGETWQEAGCREVSEETGVVLDPRLVTVYDVVTVEDGKVNLIVGVYGETVVDPVFAPDSEIIEVIETDVPIDTAFPVHTDMVRRYLLSIGLGGCATRPAIQDQSRA